MKTYQFHTQTLQILTMISLMLKGGTEIADVSMDTKAIQVAYSMGAMSVKAYQMSTKNPGYDNDAADRDVTEIALGLAF